jgi:hypothetical protein
MKTLVRIFAVVPVALLLYAVWCVLIVAPPSPAFGDPNKAQIVAQLNHLYTVASYAVVWAIQLGYVAWLALKAIGQRRAETSAR